MAQTQTPAPPAKPEMRLFIQAMYGVVIAVSFYQIIPDINTKLVFVSTLEDAKTFLISEQVFKFFLFIFTYIIAAHDWFNFHKTQIEFKNFWSSLPQIFSLFFLSQMFVSADKVHFQAWYIFGFWYTASDILKGIKFSKIDFKSKKIEFKTGKTIAHLLITIAGFFVVSNDYKNDCGHLLLFMDAY